MPLEKIIFFILFLNLKLFSNCIEDNFTFKLEDPKGNIFTEANYSSPVLAIWYEGKNTKEINRSVKDLVISSPEFNKENGKYKNTYKSVGFANYEETAVPNFLISIFINSEIKKTGTTILADKDNCYSGEGDSKNCPEGKRRKIFENGNSNILLSVDGKVLKTFSGKINAEKYRNLLTKILDMKMEGKSFCDIYSLPELSENYSL